MPEFLIPFRGGGNARSRRTLAKNLGTGAGPEGGPTPPALRAPGGASPATHRVGGRAARCREDVTGRELAHPRTASPPVAPARRGRRGRRDLLSLPGAGGGGPLRGRAGAPRVHPRVPRCPRRLRAALLPGAVCPGTAAARPGILEDYHELRPDSPVHAALAAGLREVPGRRERGGHQPGRSSPEARAVGASGQLGVLRGEELSMRLAEARRVARLWGFTPRDGELVRGLHERTEGWAAGLVLLLAGGRADVRQGGEREGALLDYFAEEVLGRAPPSTRKVLLETALLRRVEAAVAVAAHRRRARRLDPGRALPERLLRGED